MSATARHLDPVGDEASVDASVIEPIAAPSPRSHLRLVLPLRPVRASRGVFALVVSALLVVGMLTILLINTSLAQGAFTISELTSAQATLAQQEQALSSAVDAASAPRALEQAARAMGMVPSNNPVFLDVQSNAVIGTPKAAPGGTGAIPILQTPADATANEAVDAGGEFPAPLGADYDPAAADAAAAQAEANSTAASGASATTGDVAVDALVAVAAKIASTAPARTQAENNLWQDATAIDVTPLGSGDAGLEAVPVR